MKYIKIILTCIGIIGILSFIFLWWFGNSMCGKKNYNEKLSPDSSFIASHQMIDCGATTNHSTSVFLYTNQLIKSRVNVFNLNGDYSEKEVSLIWESPISLRIDYNGRTIDIRRVLFKTKGIEIKVYINGEKLTIEKLQQIEKDIKDEQSSYNVSLPEGQRWIHVEN